MTPKILAAAPVVEKIKKELISRCNALKKRGVTPTMSVVLVGDHPASFSYIKNKKKMCEEIGANFNLTHLEASIQKEHFLGVIKKLNNDSSINGIIIQLPVPDHLKSLSLPNLVEPSKDIDGFHGLNTQKLYSGSTDLTLLMPCTPKGIVYLLDHYGILLKGKNIVIIGRSLIVGKPLSLLLTNLGATVVLAHSETKNITDYTKNADIVVVAVGKAHLISAHYFDPRKKTVVVDVGMNMLNGRLVGDVDQSSVSNIVGSLTPVPGGVGPMTVISLIENLISATENQFPGGSSNEQL